MAAILAFAVACSKQEAKQAKENVENTATQVAQKVEDAIDVAVPLGEKDDPAAREKERFDEGWRTVLQNAKVPGAPQGPKPPEVQVTFAPNGKILQTACAPVSRARQQNVAGAADTGLTAHPPA